MILLGVALSVALIVVIGFAVARRVEGESANFLCAGRAMALPFVGGALMGAAVDTNATLGNTDLTASFGFWAGASLPLGLALCLLITGTFFAKPMNRMRLTTLPDYFRLRFGRRVEVLAATLMIVAFSILVAGNLVAGGYLLEYFAGVPYEVGVIAILVVAMSYTIAGGILADVYTAVIQMVICLIGAVSLLIWTAVTYGLTIPDGMGPFALGQLTDPAQGAMINWATLLALGIGDIVAIDFMQRIFCAKSPETAQRACFIGAAGIAAVGIPFALVSLASAAFLPEELDGPLLFVLLDDYAPITLAMVVLAGLVGASMSTANGAVLASSAVAVRNIGGVRRTHLRGQNDPLLRATRWAMLPIMAVAVFLAIRVAETGVLLTLAFDLMLACLITPFALGLWWRRGTHIAALGAIGVGVAVRLALFVLTPTMYGVENSVWYVENGWLTSDFDGWPTFIAFACSFLTYVALALLTPPHHERGLDIVADAEEPDPELVAVADDEPQVPAPVVL